MKLVLFLLIGLGLSACGHIHFRRTAAIEPPVIVDVMQDIG